MRGFGGDEENTELLKDEVARLTKEVAELKKKLSSDGE